MGYYVCVTVISKCEDDYRFSARLFTHCIVAALVAERRSQNAGLQDTAIIRHLQALDVLGILHPWSWTMDMEVAHFRVC